MEQQEKIDFILEVSPNLKRIIRFATAEQIDNLVKDAQYKMDHQINEAAAEYV
ncbi:hypothetical protein ACEN32_02660 [Marinilactibacillus psychrotolerans]|uniref:hypothetical protein n=1 Tax=Marinilactibacillus psychrotolerans TaxID=191770 RepID=UPI003884F3E5